MKRFVSLIMIPVLLMGLCACGKQKAPEGSMNETEKNTETTAAAGASDPAEKTESVPLWDDLDTENSAIAFGWFDGTQGRFGYFAFASDIVKSLKAVPAFPADDYTPDKLTWPVYGLACNDKTGHGVQYFWTNGFLLSSDGSVYRFNYDFKALTQRGFNFGEREVLRPVGIPGSWMVLKNAEGRWIPELMQPSAEGTPAENVSLEVTGREGSTLQLELKNGTADCWTYGDAFSVETKLQGVWYDVPLATAEHVAFFLIGYPLEPGKSETLSCSLEWYGDLPAGTYRIVKSISIDKGGAGGWDNLFVYAEFTVE